MVEDVLKSAAPKDDFARQVYEAIVTPRSWHARRAALSAVGAKGLDGWIQALQSPNWMHRRTAMANEGLLHSPENMEIMIDLLKKSLSDANKKVRRSAAEALMRVPVDDARKRTEFVPLLAAMLGDPSKRVRRMAAFFLLPYADKVPVLSAVRAVRAEPEASKRWPLDELLKRVAEHAAK